MLKTIITDFLNYCKNYNFSPSSIATLKLRLLEFNMFVIKKKIDNLNQLDYSLLITFLSDNKPSIHLLKSRVWTLRQFFHFLKVKRVIDSNPASKLPYPKIPEKEPDFLSLNQLKALIGYFINQTNTFKGIRNLIIFMFLAFLGLRLSSVIKINIEDINFTNSTIIITEKGNRIRPIALPGIIVHFLPSYLNLLSDSTGPLFRGHRNNRISNRMVQHLFQKASKELNMNIHCHILRHTAATQLNQIAGIEVTQSILGHRRQANTRKYTHLNPDIYANYMKRHPYMEVNLCNK